MKTPDEAQQEYKRRNPRGWCPWETEEATQFLAELEEALKPKYHVGLWGSFLKGEDTTNDLDILIIPHNSNVFSLEEVHSILVGMGMEMLVGVKSVHRQWKKYGSNDRKACEVWELRGEGEKNPRKVDVFLPYLKGDSNVLIDSLATEIGHRFWKQSDEGTRDVMLGMVEVLREGMGR